MSAAEYRGVWVYSEAAGIVGELLGKARELANELGTEAAAVCIGKGAREAAKRFIAAGADKVYVVENSLLETLHPETCIDALHGLVTQHRPDILLMGATKHGLEIAAKLAERVKSGCCTEVIKLEVDKEKNFLVMDRLSYGGNLVETQIVRTKPQIATIPRGIGRPIQPDPSRKGEVIEASPKINPPQMKILESKPKQATGVKVTEADVIVSFGRGVKKKEDIQIIQELAKTIGGVVGCSRPIAEDLKWLPEDQYIGLSGQKVSPKLYVACGISGQIQHLTGIRNSRIIVAINTDPKAPIFDYADYGIVGDLYQVVPALNEALRKVGTR